MTVRLIFAQSSNGYIGKDNELLFQIPEDMATFRQKTQGSTVIMGRKTWMSIPKKFRPLPGRRNVVLTTSTDMDDFQGAHVYQKLEKAIADFSGHGPIWIIGGERLYNEALAHADEIHETLVYQAFEGDARAPVIDHKQWTRVQSSPEKEHTELIYQFNIYVRNHHDQTTEQEAPVVQQTGQVREEVHDGSGEGDRIGTRIFLAQLGQEHQRRLCEGAGGCEGVCARDDQARCLQAASQAGLEAR